MDYENKRKQYIDHINAKILPHIDYFKLQKSYETDMTYAKGILNRFHEAMLTVYGGECLDYLGEGDAFAVIPGVIQGRESGKLCLALLEFDLSSHCEHWNTVYLCKFGAISQSGGKRYGTKEMNAMFIPYDYGYTANLPNDIHCDIDRLPRAIRDVLSDFRQHHAVLRNEQAIQPEKPSVLEKIRHTAKKPNEPKKDKQTRGKSVPER